jgi:alkanesulfonate monooxygenase SsuD/methylene tetrahydromethanopterin reductase-like flavin-dependent oxidoreductase (luciferase family)
VLIQAGSSGRGKRFAARWAETVFVAYPDLAAAKQEYAAMKDDIARHGRDPDLVTLNTIAYPVAAATKAEAEDKMAVIERGYREVDGLSLLAEALNFDFARKHLDEPFTNEELTSMSGMQAMRDRVVRLKPHPTPRDFLEITRRGRAREAIGGGPKEIADRLEQWFVERGCDGYVVGGTHTPGTFEDFVRFVVPELQRRGLFQRDYTGATLRENLGLPRPERGWWKQA